MSHTILLWRYNKNIQVTASFREPIKRVANINNHLFILTNNNILYKGVVDKGDSDEPIVHLTEVHDFKPIDIDSVKNTLLIVTSEGSILICDEQLTVLQEVKLIEDLKCSEGHSGLNNRVKVKNLAANEFGILYISENDKLWASGYMPQIGIDSDVPKKVSFFSGRVIYNICVGIDFAIAVVSKCKSEETSEDCFANTSCEICSSIAQNSVESLYPNSDVCPLGIKLQNNDETASIVSDKIVENGSNDSLDNNKLDQKRNIIFRNTDAAKEFLIRQISRMSSAGEEYLMECTEKPTRIIKENMTNAATFVYEGVRTVGGKVATLSRHVSSGSDYTATSENNNCQLSRKSSKDEDLSSSPSTSKKDLSELELQEHVDLILNRGISLLNREVWMWGNKRQGSLDGADSKFNSPVIISTLSSSGVCKVSLQDHHACVLTLDGRSFMWGKNNDHQVSLESNAEQITPKQFVSNMTERVTDAVCGCSFTTILTNKTNLIYFGKESQGFQIIYNPFMSENGVGDSQSMKPFSNLVSSNEYSLLNLGPRRSDSFEGFLAKEQIMLEEMLCVQQNVIKILTKKTADSKYTDLYDSLCKSYTDFLNFLAVSIDSLIRYKNGLLDLNEVTIISCFKEFMSVYRSYVDVAQDVTSMNGFAHISKLVVVSPSLYKLKSGVLKEKDSNDKDISLLLLSPVKRVNNYLNFFQTFSDRDIQAKWKEFIEYVDLKTKEAEKTISFWLHTGRNLDYLMEPKRRVICDSQSDPINLQNASRFSSHRFVLFSDVFAHINGSSTHIHPLALIWLETLHHDTLHLICLKMPEDFLTLVAPDGVAKNTWYHALQHAIKMALNKNDLYQPPLARSGTYTFVKSEFCKSATYTGRWSNAKMHGSGKLVWSDGRVYTGQFGNNCFDGYGVLDIPDTGTYEGEWKDNKQNGYGTFTYNNKDVYRGYFKDGVPHGHGFLRKGNFMTNSASLFIGEWVAGKKSGYGVMDDISTGEKYLGCWSDSKREGSGLIVTSEGTYYEGNFHNDLLSGHGIMILEDKTCYEGEFRGTGIISGKGTLTLPSGHIIEGTLTGSFDEEVKINGGSLRKPPSPVNSPVPKSFGKLCTSPSQKWKALFRHCYQVLGLSAAKVDTAVSLETPKIWQNVAVYLANASSLKRSKRDDNSLQNSLNNLDVIPPFGRDKLTMDSYMEIKTYLNRAFESTFHPLGSLLNNLSEAYISSYSGKVHPILVNHAIMEIIDISQRVYEIIRYLFPALPTCDTESVIFGNDDKFEVISYQSLLFPVILPKVYNCLCTLLSLKNENQERRYKKVLIEWNKLSERSLMNLLSVEKKFFKLDRPINLPDKSSAFVEAIETLQQIISVFLPIEKLIVIRNTVEKMTPVVQNLLGDSYVWNMDDLFPLFLYVVVRARIPHLGTELEFIEHFMDQNLENGELGIMFTTLKACYQQILQDKSFI